MLELISGTPAKPAPYGYASLEMTKQPGTACPRQLPAVLPTSPVASDKAIESEKASLLGFTRSPGKLCLKYTVRLPTFQA